MTGSTDLGRAPAKMKLPAAKTVIQAGMIALLALGLSACGGKGRPKADLAASRVTTIGVNSYLWRASLDTLSFMPLLQTDSNGGVIVSDWYANPKNPGERVKVAFQVANGMGIPIVGEQVMLESSPPGRLFIDGERMSNETGLIEVTVSAPAEGDYTLKATLLDRNGPSKAATATMKVAW